MKLTNPRHERFAQEYLSNLNATEAYRRAYPKASVKTAEANGCRLLGNAKVASRVAGLQAERAKRTEVTADKVIAELAMVGFSDMRSFTRWGPAGVSLIDSATLTEDQSRCVAEVSETVGEKSSSLRFKLHDKVGALIKLGQHLGIRFVERHEHTGKDGAPLPAAPILVYEIPDNGRGVVTVNGNGRHGHRVGA